MTLAYLTTQVLFLFIVTYGLAVMLGKLTWAFAALGIISLINFWIYYILLSIHVKPTIFYGFFMAYLVGLGISKLKDSIACNYIVPIGAATLSAIIIFVWVHGIGNESPKEVATRVAAEFWTHSLPGDNQIPLDFAKGFSNGFIPHPLHADWLSSDRPPLQTALYIMTPGFWIFGPEPLGYQAASIWLQMQIIVATWILVLKMGSNRRDAVLSMIAVFFMPLLLVNGAYVWPKLLAAAFVCMAVTEHFYGDRNNIYQGILVGGLSALSLLSHGGSIFALSGMLISSLILNSFGSPRYIFFIACTFLATYMPWIFYQHFIDPPGNRIAKLFLAGVHDINTKGVLESVYLAYMYNNLNDIIAAKISNVKMALFGISDVYSSTFKAILECANKNIMAAKTLLKDVRVNQFFGIITASGLLGFSFFLIPLSLLSKQLRPLGCVVATTLIVWWGLLFEMNTAVTHHGSYFLEIAVVAGSVAWLCSVSYPLAVSIVSIHAGLTLFQYTL